MSTIKTHIVIKAPAEKVWETLMDFENHPKWNPFIKSITGNKDVGGTLTVSIKPPNGGGMTFKPLVIANKTNEEFRWSGKLLFKGLFDGEHYFLLETVDPNTTVFTHGEKFSGLLVGIFGKMLEKTKEGFEQMNEALKSECEKSQHSN